MARGLIGEPFRADPGCTAFFFRIQIGSQSFDIALGSHRTLASAHAGARKLYPSATILALKETDFDLDGLPKVRVRGQLFTPDARTESGA